MKTIKLPYIFVAIVFLCSAIAPLTVTQDVSAMTAKEKCERRVKILNNRGKKMARKSKELQDKYKKANKGWKDKIKTNKDLATKYSTDDRLEAKAKVLTKEAKQFQTAVKDYNNVKRPYIQERNVQIKRYKKFSTNCATGAGRVAAAEKIRQRDADSKTLNEKSKAVSEVYKSKIRKGILDMRAARKALADARKGMKEVEKADQASIDGAYRADDNDTGDDADNLFDDTELDPNSNVDDGL